MAHKHSGSSLLRLILLCILSSGAIISAVSPPLPDPKIAASEPVAFRIFNAVHSAFRQWGSSVHHNGLSFIPVTVPQGSIFYHGGEPERPQGLEWLAFEPGHAYEFSQIWWQIPGKRPSPRHDRSATGPLHPHIPPAAQPGLQRPLSEPSDPTSQDEPAQPPSPPRGYMHAYRAARPLRLLYIDGMSAAVSFALGTSDSQDFILLDWDVDTPPNDWASVTT